MKCGLYKWLTFHRDWWQTFEKAHGRSASRHWRLMMIFHKDSWQTFTKANWHPVLKALQTSPEGSWWPHIKVHESTWWRLMDIPCKGSWWPPHGQVEDTDEGSFQPLMKTNGHPTHLKLPYDPSWRLLTSVGSWGHGGRLITTIIISFNLHVHVYYIYLSEEYILNWWRIHGLTLYTYYNNYINFYRPKQGENHLSMNNNKLNISH